MRTDRTPRGGLLPAARHTDCSLSYGGTEGQGLATTTTAYFTACGVVHHVARFWRHDMLSTGKLEIYTLEPWPGYGYTTSSEYGWYAYTAGDFLRYANEQSPSRIDLAAMHAIACVAGTTYTSAHADSMSRAAALEME